MLTKILDALAPHHCLICQKIGHTICPDCKNYITSNHNNFCLKCGLIIKTTCKNCRLPYQKSWTLGPRTTHLHRAIDLYKFSAIRSFAEPFADMLATITPDFPPDTAIVPIPTTRPHIRERGFDHITIIARRFAQLKSCTYSPILTRQSSTTQVGSARDARLTQASSAFSCSPDLNPKTHFVILDDVYTTGATILAAAKLLKANGAKKISVVLLARQPDNFNSSKTPDNSLKSRIRTALKLTPKSKSKLNSQPKPKPKS